MTLDPKSTHYDAGGIEAIDVISAKLTPEQFRGYVLGNLLKYAQRLNHKGQARRDAEKIRHYAELLVGTFEADDKEANADAPESVFELPAGTWLAKYPGGQSHIPNPRGRKWTYCGLEIDEEWKIATTYGPVMPCSNCLSAMLRRLRA